MKEEDREKPWGLFGAALVFGLLAFVLFVLPAEFDRDPTGFGALVGIKGMSGYSVGAMTPQEAGYREDEAAFFLSPFESVEYKYALDAGQSLVFSWRATGDENPDILFDMHSEEEGRDPEDSVTFALGNASNAHGTYVAPFNGIHGWYWENRGAEAVEIKLRTSGFYRSATVYSASGPFTKSFEDPVD
ncbi:MAG TPA: hypothetical protein DCP57_01135 [Gammaproteobacteria bacterium]|jgi:hypothetical protein|nr:MAG: hypothetical protein CBC94_004260 [Gammaproteobacteria bacterium TMED134]RPG47541.1 MAG: hypothetical protein CBC94_002425 [Gammaproteobacteria bacterium TMED134]RZO70800.1 MAG: hypothetical protein EVA67_06815 [OM182 bacterium]HAL41016.1 hypothetical protein [Gammaproteobacteria bacterium]HBK19397.1 hypothetical protein [Gammaproteobacteria bacterium]|tara:strand:- start:7341 stop:7904 length:564 start_codon:yes stop_codon:yes gene_type:complete